MLLPWALLAAEEASRYERYIVRYHHTPALVWATMPVLLDHGCAYLLTVVNNGHDIGPWHWLSDIAGLGPPCPDPMLQAWVMWCCMVWRVASNCSWL